MSFYSWFVKFHGNTVVANMLKPVGHAACLGDPPREFCTNNSEALNSALKQFLSYKKFNWPTLNEKIKEFVQMHFKEAKKSLIGIGQYIIRPEYDHLRVSPSKWFLLNDNQKQSVLQRFHHVSVEDM